MYAPPFHNSNVCLLLIYIKHLFVSSIFFICIPPYINMSFLNGFHQLIRSVKVEITRTKGIVQNTGHLFIFRFIKIGNVHF
nr:MAG TPA: hypothetical protein [Caudoviricetes sp.]